MGIISSIGGIKVSRVSPKISVRIVNSVDDLSSGVLNIRRVGENYDFVEYTPSRVSTDFLEFTFDELLFSKAFGRYSATLLVNGVARTSFNLQYVDASVLSVSNA